MNMRLVLVAILCTANGEETCENDAELCNNIDYTSAICRQYKTDVYQDAAEKQLLLGVEKSKMENELRAIFGQGDYSKNFVKAEFEIDSLEPNNPADIQSEDISGSGNNGFFFAYTMITTHALMNICGRMKVTYIERFRESILSEEEWQQIIEDQLTPFDQMTLAGNPTLEIYNPNAGKRDLFIRN